MLFIDNKYTKWYFGIISSAKQKPSTGYTEKHHIIPRCMKGSDKNDNLVKLTAKQHFICHLLLIKMVEDKMILSKLKYAAILLSKDYTISSRIYEMIRGNIVQDSEWVKKRTSQRIGKKHSQSAIIKLTKSAKDRHVIYVSCVSCKTTTNYGNYIKNHNGQCRKYRGPAWNTGKTMPTKGSVLEKIKCKYCDKLADNGNLSRWHNNNCKNKPKGVNIHNETMHDYN